MSNIKVTTFKDVDNICISLDMRLHIVVGLVPADEKGDEAYVYVEDLRYSGTRTDNRISRYELASTIEELAQDLGYKVSDEADGSIMNITRRCMTHIQNIGLAYYGGCEDVKKYCDSNGIEFEQIF